MSSVLIQLDKMGRTIDELTQDNAEQGNTIAAQAAKIAEYERRFGALNGATRPVKSRARKW